MLLLFKKAVCFILQLHLHLLMTLGVTYSMSTVKKLLLQCNGYFQ